MSVVLPAMAGEPTLNTSESSGGNPTSVEPARIELRADRSHVTADDADNIKITAYMYDVQGNPVADGYRINFTIGSATGNNFTNNGNFDYVPGAMGRLGSPGNPFNFYQGATWNNSGNVSVQFGWINEIYSGNNSTIWAYAADNASIFASIKVYSSAPGASWTGYVVDSSGAGIGGIPVTLHVMGVDKANSTTNRTVYYEIYNMARTTSSSPPSIGKFNFDYIVLSGTAYGYVDAEVRFADNRTVYGKSDNFSLNRSATSIGNITLAIQPHDAAQAIPVASPSVSARPSLGFEAAFFTAGCLGAAYLIARKGKL